MMKGKNVVVTGGAGFIGSHLVDLLVADNNVTVIDMPSPRKKYVNPRARVLYGDLLDGDFVAAALKGADFVFHFAANPDVRLGQENPLLQLRQNVATTQNVLEAMRLNGVKNIMFASSSVVYGDGVPTPTPEGFGPLKPISIYGATKLAGEAIISGYCHTFGMNAWIFRFANVIGPRLTHGVIFDLVNKLRANPAALEVLGDGTQRKSYVHVDDCIDGVLFAIEKTHDRVNILNIGSEGDTDVSTIAEEVVRAVSPKAGINYVSGAAGGRGWRGDIKTMLLDISAMKKLGWKPRYTSAQAVTSTIRSMAGEL